MVSHRLKVRARLLHFPLRVFHATLLLTSICEMFCLPLHAREVVSNEIFPEASTDLPLGSRALTPACSTGSWLCVLLPPSSVEGYPTRHLGPSSLDPQDLAQCPLYSGCVN